MFIHCGVDRAAITVIIGFCAFILLVAVCSRTQAVGFMKAQQTLRLIEFLKHRVGSRGVLNARRWPYDTAACQLSIELLLYQIAGCWRDDARDTLASSLRMPSASSWPQGISRFGRRTKFGDTRRPLAALYCGRHAQAVGLMMFCRRMSNNSCQRP